MPALTERQDRAADGGETGEARTSGSLPDDDPGVFETDPWSAVLDDWAEESDRRFGYPTGIP